MSERIEHVVTVEQSVVVSQAMSRHFERLLELGAETAKNRACVDCAHLALCGIVINALRTKKSGTNISALGKVDVHGVKIDETAENICPKELVDEALRRNQSGDFWLLEADELNHAELEVRTAQTVQLAAEHVRRTVSNKIIK
ncbi:MAG: hypothetical protein EOT05_04255 [Candidatus Microsaccharimonas sossegonensis]|uniref:Uncharacterized protein n=1 Tax=Candidatus Microsaccharimonas sossegonensis TaxID=2506948 RepID=A0A4Q0AIA0_9BACT|nr:MAG: hypothetical protein EOT05_04255 [Candidatus Microsaccharimonas sossegonensis]